MMKKILIGLLDLILGNDKIELCFENGKYYVAINGRAIVSSITDNEVLANLYYDQYRKELTGASSPAKKIIKKEKL